MKNETIQALVQNPAGHYLDATYGRGGHSRAILNALDPSATLFCSDRDHDAIQDAKDRFSAESRVWLAHSDFENLNSSKFDAAKPHTKTVKHITQNLLDGVLFDCGVSTPQLLDSNRGISFTHDGPLDMRMDQSQAISAETYLQNASQQEIALALRNYGQEKNCNRIAKEIVRMRIKNPLRRTRDLVAAIERAGGSRDGKHAATRSFQAIRIIVNDELNQIASLVAQSVAWLKPMGRLVTLTFHSLELRSVRAAIRNTQGQLKRVGTGLQASIEERRDNPSARSAQLEVFIKC